MVRHWLCKYNFNFITQQTKTSLTLASLAASPRCSREMISGVVTAWSSSPLLSSLQISWSLVFAPPAPWTPSPGGRSQDRRGQDRGLLPWPWTARRVFSSQAGPGPLPGAATHHCTSVEPGQYISLHISGQFTRDLKKTSIFHPDVNMK